MNSSPLLSLDPADNVLVAIRSIAAGEYLQIGTERFLVSEAINLGHKIAARPIRAGEKIIKYRAPIGSALRDIGAGEHVHLHNMKSDYLPTYTLETNRAFHPHADH